MRGEREQMEREIERNKMKIKGEKEIKIKGIEQLIPINAH